MPSHSGAMRVFLLADYVGGLQVAVDHTHAMIRTHARFGHMKVERRDAPNRVDRVEDEEGVEVIFGVDLARQVRVCRRQSLWRGGLPRPLAGSGG